MEAESGNPFSLASQQILVTGAASGIGAATCVVLSRMGAKLVMVDRNETGLLATQARCRPTDRIVVLDLGETSSIKDAVLKTVSETGLLHGMVHLAGMPYISPLKTITEEKYTALMRVNTYAGLELAKAFTNKKVSGGIPVSIIFIASVYALVGSAGNAGYAMSKAALLGLTKSLAIELAPKKIRVNCIAPGFVKTTMMQDTGHFFDEGYNKVLEDLHPLGLGDADDVANACAFLLSPASKWITGSVMSVDGGFTAK